ncbi:transcriptional activator, Rgg/GadR/MutR family domain protein [Enterococcus faecalis 13-SD-W-01]|nr:transcriptional activator, Rgg/GadR/MutR family domain protein [Enterococcus faecalis 13-SD-W-01]
MKKTLGETIGEIRKNKRIPVSSLCSGVIAKSTYTRCVQNKTSISTEIFFEFLTNLNVTFEEFEYIRNDYSKDIYIELMEQIKVSFESRNLIKLKEIKKICNQKDKKHIIKFHHLNLLCDLLIQKMIDPSSELTQSNELITYLLRVNQWYHYELILFNNCLFVCSPDLIDIILKNIVKNYTQYLDLSKYGNELTRVLVNIYTFYLNHFQFEKLIKINTLIQNIPLNEDCLFERTAVLFFDGVHELLFKGSEDSHKKIKEAILIFDILHCYNFKKMFITLYEQIKTLDLSK